MTVSESDPRSIRTRELLRQALISLAAEKGFSSLTIQEVTNRAVLPHYADFYDMKHVLILGRCTSGLGGTLIVDEASKVLKTEFPELASRLQVQLPDEHSRRVGQSIAAASLPMVNKGAEQAA